MRWNGYLQESQQVSAISLSAVLWVAHITPETASNDRQTNMRIFFRISVYLLPWTTKRFRPGVPIGHFFWELLPFSLIFAAILSQRDPREGFKELPSQQPQPQSHPGPHPHLHAI
jgi:hypothetical protein